MFQDEYYYAARATSKYVLYKNKKGSKTLTDSPTSSLENLLRGHFQARREHVKKSDGAYTETLYT